MSNCQHNPGLDECLGVETARLMVGDPVNVVTGANVDIATDFRLWGPISLSCSRYYDSSRVRSRLSMGFGHGHVFSRALVMAVDGVAYRDPFGAQHQLGALLKDGEECAAGPWRLRRLALRLYRLYERGKPAADFEFIQGFDRPARLKRLSHGLAEAKFQYAENGRLISIVDSRERRIDVEEAVDGRLISMAFPAVPGQAARRLVSYEYDAAGNLARVVDPYGHECRFTYDDNNRMTRRTDRRGYAFFFEYDKLGRCTRARGEDGVLDVQMRYDPAVGHTVVRRADGGEWQYFYDPGTKALLQVIDPACGVKQFIADPQGRPHMEVDPLGNQTLMRLNEAGSPVAKVLPNGRVVELPAAPEDMDGPGHRESSCACEWEHGWLIDYASAALPLLGAEDSFDLPYSVRRAIQTQGAQDRVAFELSGPDALAESGADPYPLPRFGRVFDDFGVLVRQHGPGGKVRRWLYDANGNVARFIDFDGAQEQLEYKSFNHLASWTRPLGLCAKFEWNRSETLAGFTDPGGTTTRFAHDTRDLLVEVRRNGALKEKYERDAAGNLIARLGPSGKSQLVIEVGPGNLPVRKLLESGGVEQYKYDSAGRLAAINSSGESTVFQYDQYGERCADLRGGRGVEHKPFTARTPGSTVVLEKFATTYHHRPDGSVEITDPAGTTHRVAPFANGLVKREFANGTTEVSQFDSCGRCLMKVTYRSGEESIVWKRVFAYSGEGDLLRVDDSRAGETLYSYDAAHRITSVQRPGSLPMVFQHDDGGNLVRGPGLVDVVIGPGNRLAGANGDSFLYNDRHHICSRTGRVNHGYVYDSRDRLIACDTGHKPWSAEYDAIGRRVRARHGDDVTEYFWDGDRLCAEALPDARLRVYVYEYPLAMTPMLFLEYGGVDADPLTGRVYTVLADQIGTPVSVLQESGEEVWSAVIDPYGAAHISPHARLEFSFRFPGHWFDPATGLHYNRFRYYSPELGRYLQSDPAGLAGGHNLYAYCTSPLANVDVRGLRCPSRGRRGKTPEEAPDEEGAPDLSARFHDRKKRAAVADAAGMDAEDLNRLQRTAKEKGWLIIVRFTNRNSLQHHKRDDAIPKPVSCKLKTDADTGLVTQRANPDKEAPHGYYWDHVGNLRTKSDDKVLYGDYDLQGIYERSDKNDPNSQWKQVDSNDPATLDVINRNFDGREMSAHGGNDAHKNAKGKMLRQPGEDEGFLIIDPEKETSHTVGPPTAAGQDYYRNDQKIKWPYRHYRRT